MSLAAAANPPCHVARQAIYKWYQTFVISNDIIVDLVLALVVHTRWVFSVWNGTYNMALSTGAVYCLATYLAYMVIVLGILAYLKLRTNNFQLMGEPPVDENGNPGR